ncbi:MAG: Gfo/Idh/MocA family oxidoreductase [Caldiserica bacterium]|nr:Gfo/Idh/MocA family oxidoreductase [Caldisericota bacterium]
MNKFRFGIIGCGVIGPWHADAIRAIPEAELVACADVVEEKARTMGEKYGIDWHTDINELLQREDIDIVNICVPSGLRKDIAVPAARAGKHIIAEKPLEITLEKCDEIIKAARDNGVKLGVIFQARFSDGVQTLINALNKGKFGKLVYGEASVKWYRTQEYYDSAGWRGTWALDGGGALMNQSIHVVDLLQWIMGDVESLFAYTGLLAHERIETEDTAIASIKFKSGALGSIVGMTSAYPGYAKKIEIYGTKGSAILENDAIVAWNFAEEDEEDKLIKEGQTKKKTEAVGASSATAGLAIEGHRRQIFDFIEAIKKDAEPLVNGEEGRKSVEIILGIYQSAKERKEVRFPIK